ncbi:MAG: Rab family GTPase [Candidatus Helarchaeota archaeon]
MVEDRKKFPFKIVVVGDPAVGKTSIVRRFADDQFEESYIHTIGADFNVKVVKLGDLEIILTVWDIGGHEHFNEIRPYYYEGAHAAICVFDLTMEKSFKSIPKWFKDLREYLPEVPCILIGNKADLDHENNEEKIKKLINEFKFDFYSRTSAKTSENVSKTFEKLAEICMEYYINQ